jgi:PAS domain S-box-containing protein
LILIPFEGDLGAHDTVRLIENTLGVGNWRYDPITKQSYWSPGLYELLGLNPGTTVPSYEELDRITHPDDRRPKGEIEALLLEGLPLKREFRIIRPDGRLRWIYSQIEILLNAAGEPARVLGVALDITDNHESLQQLRVGAERYSAFVRVTEGLAWIASPEGSITALPNWKVARYGSPQLVYGHGWLDLLHEGERDEALKNWSLSVESGRPYKVEHRLLQPDGAYRWFRCSAVPILSEDGSVQEWMGVSTDVHDAKLLDLSGSLSRLTGAQMRAARGILNWSVKQLAARAGVSPAVVRRLEEYDGTLPGSGETIELFQKTFSDAGIEFLFPQVGKPGIRPR